MTQTALICLILRVNSLSRRSNSSCTSEPPGWLADLIFFRYSILKDALLWLFGVSLEMPGRQLIELYPGKIYIKFETEWEEIVYAYG